MSNLTTRNDQIEMLRAIAVMMVLILHVQVIPYYESGVGFIAVLYAEYGLGAGVDLFLVISGFVITKSMLRIIEQSKSSKKSQLLAFWTRRIFRLLPSAWFWLFVIVVYRIILYGSSGEFELLGGELLVTLIAMLNGLNIYAGFCLPGSEASICTPNILFGHYWTLSLEEQFYLLFPFLFFFVNRKLFIAILVLAIGLQLFWTRPPFTQFFFLKTDALCWGVLLAFFDRTAAYEMLRKLAARSPLLSLGLLLILIYLMAWAAGQTWGVFTMRSYGISLVAALCAAIVLLASFEANFTSQNNVLARLLVYLGSRSYAIYVVHLIIFLAIGETRDWYDPGISSASGRFIFDWFLVLVATAITFLLAEWNYRTIEIAWRQRGREISARILQK